MRDYNYSEIIIVIFRRVLCIVLYNIISYHISYATDQFGNAIGNAHLRRRSLQCEFHM